MKIVLITSNSYRHKFLATRLATQTQLELIISEEKSPAIEDWDGYSEEDANLIKNHFLSRKQSEEHFFGDFGHFPKHIPLLKFPHGQINSYEVLDKIRKAGPEYIVLFGSSIIKPPLIDLYCGRIINLHLGLSPYYRGSATNLFPFFYKEPECVGATIHLATSKVDDGAVLAQVRPEISKGDDLHSIGNKSILEAGNKLPNVLLAYSQKEIKPKPLWGEGRVCRNKEFKPSVLQTIHSNFTEGMLEDYLEKKEERNMGKPIIQWPR